MKQLRDQMVSRCVGKLADGMADAADKLRELLGSESEGIRLRASVALIELGLKVKEV